MARVEKTSVRLTAEQLALLKQLATADAKGKELLAAVEKKPRNAGAFAKIAEMTFHDPQIEVEELIAALPNAKERQVRFDHKRMLKLVAVLKAVGRWNDKPATVKLETKKAA